METLTGRKILFVITKSNWGGAQQYVFTLATHAQKAGAVVLVALGGTGEVGASTGLLARRLDEAGIRTIFLPSFARDIGMMREWSAFFELLRVVRAERPDVLHLNSSKAGGLGALAGRILGTRRIVFTAHGWAHGESRPLYQRTSIWITSWLTAQLCHRIIVLSKNDARQAPVLFSRRHVVVIHNGIGRFPLFAPADARTKIATHAHTATRFPFWFLTLAELHPNKGLDTLLQAFTTVSRERNDSALIVVGEGQCRAELTGLIRTLGLEDRVFLIGFLENAREYLSAADVFVLSSRKEGLPLVLLEAGQARLAVIATSVGAIPEVIDNGISGLIVPTNNEQKLADALLQIATNATERERMAYALHARIIRDFSEETMLRETARVYY